MEEKCILHPDRDCIGKAAAALLEKRVDDLEAGQKKEAEFRELYYKERLERAKRDAALDEKINSINEKQDTMSEDIKQVLEAQRACAMKPAKRWEAIVDKAIWAVLAAVIAFVLANVGLGV